MSQAPLGCDAVSLGEFHPGTTKPPTRLVPYDINSENMFSRRLRGKYEYQEIRDINFHDVHCVK
jgi:hypothetical protein